jgi:hypothetical protein
MRSQKDHLLTVSWARLKRPYLKNKIKMKELANCSNDVDLDKQVRDPKVKTVPGPGGGGVK